MTEITVAYGSVPKDGGTFTFYRNQRPALAALGVDLRCVTVGQAQCRLWEDAYADEGCVRLAPRVANMRKQAETFVEWCRDERVDIVIGVNSAAILSSIPHLPRHVRAVARCANAFDHGYRITVSGGDRLARIIALMPRLRDDLVNQYGVAPHKLRLIPNGIAPAAFDAAARLPRGAEGPLRLGFLGRLEHTQKGVMHLPKIVDALHGRAVDFHLRIAGKGRDGPALQEALKPHMREGRVEFLGALPPARIPAFLAETDAYLFTSHFEGCPNALLEANMAGCAPVSWVIAGITDYIITHGETGLLCEMGDCDAFAAHIASLAADRGRLARIARAAGEDARARFTNDIAARAYAELFRTVMAEPPPGPPPKPWRAFEPDPNFPQTWRSHVPPALKDAIKRLRPRRRVSAV
ncbi:MAG: glycosyltransferase family 4 protein [Caulobacterales bacterium]|nr:glycosyltransferase family 4 protein [Caulobacterales bacterium]